MLWYELRALFSWGREEGTTASIIEPFQTGQRGVDSMQLIRGLIMYTTIEADIENGQIKSPEIEKLPAKAHVLITLLGSGEKKYDFSAVSGQLRWNGDALEVQREIRDEW